MDVTKLAKDQLKRAENVSQWHWGPFAVMSAKMPESAAMPGHATWQIFIKFFGFSIYFGVLV